MVRERDIAWAKHMQTQLVRPRKCKFLMVRDRVNHSVGPRQKRVWLLVLRC